jgi:hypothetical protein
MLVLKSFSPKGFGILIRSFSYAYILLDKEKKLA